MIIETTTPNKLLNQPRNNRGLVFTFGLFARWLASALAGHNIRNSCQNESLESNEMPGYLRPHIQTMYPGPSDPKYRKEQNPFGEPGSYWVEFTFQVNPRLSSEESPKALRQEFIGDSLLIIGKQLARGETRKHVFTIRTGANSSMEYFVYCNKSGFLSHINMHHKADSFDEAISCAQDNIKPFLLRPIRNRIAHGLLDENVCKPEDQISDNEIYRFLPVLKFIAEKLLTSSISEKG